jgi:cerevisin
MNSFHFKGLFLFYVHLYVSMSLLCFILIICLLHNLAVFADDLNAGPARPELADSSNYIVVFKPNMNSIKIRNQIQRMQMHQVSINDTNTLYNTSTNKSFIPSSNNTNTIRYNSIGKFKWYSAQFHAEAIEQLLQKKHAANATAGLDDNDDDAVHYWVKDAKFSLQEFIQTNPPSWVKLVLHLLTQTILQVQQ